jgi:hypothetical protein
MPVYQLATGIFSVMLRAGEAVKVSQHFVKPHNITCITVHTRHVLRTKAVISD